MHAAPMFFAFSLALALAATPSPAESLPDPPPGVSVRRDLSFLAEGRQEKLDLYQPAERAAGTRSPAVVIIHGGGWTGGDKGARREFITGTTLAQAGYVCVSVNYSLTAGKRWPLKTQSFDLTGEVLAFFDRHLKK